MKNNYQSLKLVILGGNSPENKQWVERFSSELKTLSEDIVTIDYSHWGSTEKTPIDLDRELDKLSDVLKGSDRYVIIGKSAGALLALKGIYDKRIFPMACIFFGTAVIWGRANHFQVDDWLESFPIPTLFIQKEGDPAMRSDELLSLLKERHVKSYEVSVLPGNTHEYDEYEGNTKLVKAFENDCRRFSVEQ